MGIQSGLYTFLTGGICLLILGSFFAINSQENSQFNFEFLIELLKSNFIIHYLFNPLHEVWLGLSIVILVGTLVPIGWMAIASIFCREVTDSTSDLIDAMQQIIDRQATFSNGILTARVIPKGTPETQKLGQIFNRMADAIEYEIIEKNRYAERLKQFNIDLEKLIQQRTQELAIAHREILQLNYRLKAENSRLSAELDVACQLQQMLMPTLPELEKIPNLEIAAFTEPATEVGGDYYDIFQDGDRIKIAIGDVTGHGLESGVLVIMVQTAVRTLVADKTADTMQFFTTLNQAIYENVQRMNTHRHLTLLLAEYHAGKLRLCGQHEEVIIVREGGKIERIDTIDLGFPIGLEANIREFVSEVEIDFHPGDTMVFYTDGITEAENHQGQLYGIDRLCQILSENWFESAGNIQQAVMADVKLHIGDRPLHDDMTLLALKRQVEVDS
jgi:serine phosphatase RsbU (regulator of sigma subunit)